MGLFTLVLLLLIEQRGMLNEVGYQDRGWPHFHSRMTLNRLQTGNEHELN